ncbi:hypothetical protein [Microbispora bryophytorum]|uniref:hypothetical protein n=1 Tax=Microbispora bryophytorum TaxID=1460882 RepID=UPI003411171F
MDRQFRLGRGRLVTELLVLSSCALLLAACGRPPLADELPRPVAVGRTAEGKIRLVVPLCEGEAIKSVEVQNHRTARPIWRVSRPARSEEQQEVIVLGDAHGFTREDVPLRSPLPANMGVTVELADGPPLGSGFLLKDVPEDFARTDRVLTIDGEKVPEEEFRRNAAAEYC